jgi:CheY-like chemotaxis protein
MPNSVFVKVVGFRDAERHALNTVFRLSQERDSRYELWAPAAGLSPHLLLIDTDSYEGGLELESPGFNRNLKFICAGEKSPEGAWRSFRRPLNWSAVVHAMDQLFSGAGSAGIDIDIDIDSGEAVKGVSPLGRRRTLLVDVSRDRRMYLRARLALSGLLEVEEATDAATALQMTQQRHFDLVIVNLDTPEIKGWQLVDQMVALEPAIGSIVLCSRNTSWQTHERADQAGCRGVLELPFDPTQIIEMLRKV